MNFGGGKGVFEVNSRCILRDLYHVDEVGIESVDHCIERDAVSPAGTEILYHDGCFVVPGRLPMDTVNQAKTDHKRQSLPPTY